MAKVAEEVLGAFNAMVVLTNAPLPSPRGGYSAEDRMFIQTYLALYNHWLFSFLNEKAFFQMLETRLGAEPAPSISLSEIQAVLPSFKIIFGPNAADILRKGPDSPLWDFRYEDHPRHDIVFNLHRAAAIAFGARTLRRYQRSQEAAQEAVQCADALLSASHVGSISGLAMLAAYFFCMDDNVSGRKYLAAALRMCGEQIISERLALSIVEWYVGPSFIVGFASLTSFFCSLHLDSLSVACWAL